MILVDVSQYQFLKGRIVPLLKTIIKRKIKYNEHNLTEVLNLYTTNDILTAIESGIYRINNFVFMQTDGLNGKILRTLEYGSGRTKALHIITQAVREVIGGRNG